MTEAGIDKLEREAIRRGTLTTKRTHPEPGNEAPFRRAMRQAVGLGPEATGEDIRKGLWAHLSAPMSDSEREATVADYRKEYDAKHPLPKPPAPDARSPAKTAPTPSAADLVTIVTKHGLPLNPASPPGGLPRSDVTFPPPERDSLVSNNPEAWPKVHRDSDGGVWDEGESYVRDPAGRIMSHAETRERYGSERPWEDRASMPDSLGESIHSESPDLSRVAELIRKGVIRP